MSFQFWLALVAVVILLIIAYCLCVGSTAEREFYDPDETAFMLSMEVRDKDLLDWDQIEDLKNHGYTTVQINGNDVIVTTEEFTKIGGTI